MTSIRATSSTCTNESVASGANGIWIAASGNGSRIWERQGEEVILMPGPTTLAIRSEISSIATLGAHRHSQELLLRPNCTQILTALARDIDIVIRRRPKSPHVAGRGNGKSKNYVFGRRNENAGAAGLSPDTMINAVRLGPVVFAWVQLLVADHQLAVKQMQFFHSGMAVRGHTGFPADQYLHASAVFFGSCSRLLSGDCRRHFFPFRAC